MYKDIFCIYYDEEICKLNWCLRRDGKITTSFLFFKYTLSIEVFSISTDELVRIYWASGQSSHVCVSQNWQTLTAVWHCRGGKKLSSIPEQGEPRNFSLLDCWIFRGIISLRYNASPFMIFDHFGNLCSYRYRPSRENSVDSYWYVSAQTSQLLFSFPNPPPKSIGWCSRITHVKSSCMLICHFHGRGLEFSRCFWRSDRSKDVLNWVALR